MTFYSKILKIIFIELSKNHKMRKNVNNIHGLGFRIGPTFESFFLGPTLNLKSNHNFLQSINYFNFQFCFQSALFSTIQTQKVRWIGKLPIYTLKIDLRGWMIMVDIIGFSAINEFNHIRELTLKFLNTLFISN